MGLFLWGEGGRIEIKTAVWSDPVEGSDDASKDRKAGNICGLSKASSIPVGLWVPVKGNPV